MYADARSPESGRVPGAEVAGGCEPPDVGAEN